VIVVDDDKFILRGVLWRLFISADVELGSSQFFV